MKSFRCLARAVVVLSLAGGGGMALAAPATPAQLAAEFRAQVDRRLDPPAEETLRYGALADAAFARAGVAAPAGEYLVIVDRDPWVQALLLVWRGPARRYELVGAAPVSTGRPGTFDHFETPLGVFEHSPANPDFRAEGTFNDNGIRGYGVRGMRVFDLGWQRVPKGWGDGATIEMRLQMHATDPDALEPRLGSVQSKGCIRIPASVNQWLDLHGVLDAEYEKLAREGHKLWVLRQERDVVADAGRYVVVVESGRSERPDWSPGPFQPHRAVTPARPVTPPVTKPAPPSWPLRR